MGNPPLVFVLSEKDCLMLLFPFINDKGGDLVECVLLPEIPIWASGAGEGALLNRNLLVMMLLLCGGRGKGDAIDYAAAQVTSLTSLQCVPLYLSDCSACAALCGQCPVSSVLAY